MKLWIILLVMGVVFAFFVCWTAINLVNIYNNQLKIADIKNAAKGDNKIDNKGDN